ncbi:MAG: cytochrome c [Burkholderiales bacterium]|jgi:mono/diheme cytochrome c family protein
MHSLLRSVRPAASRGAATVLAVAAFAAAGPGAAQTPTPSPVGVELGRHEFESNCATCHGMEARGDGPMKPFLAREPADLTAIARRHGGTFPRSAIADLIDGRGVTGPGPHGTRDMPVWGRIYREQSDAQTRGTPFPAEWSVRGRIVALVDYLQSIQRP